MLYSSHPTMRLWMSRKKRPNVIKLVNSLGWGDWFGFGEELRSGSDRTAAILGGVFLDEHLRLLLVAFLVDDPLVNELFEVERPLSSFSARIKMAYALGLISKRAYDDLEQIRWIRNAFAHTMHGISFDTEAILAACSKLQTPSVIHPSVTREKDRSNIDGRSGFTITVQILSMEIARQADEITSSRRTVPPNGWALGLQYPDDDANEDNASSQS